MYWQNGCAAAHLSTPPCILPSSPGVCSPETAASLPAHVEDFLGGSVNQCWAGFKVSVGGCGPSRLALRVAAVAAGTQPC